MRQSRRFCGEGSRGPLRKGNCPVASCSEQQRGCWLLGTWFGLFLAAELGHTAYPFPPVKWKAPENPVSGMVSLAEQCVESPLHSACRMGRQVPLPRPPGLPISFMHMKIQMCATSRPRVDGTDPAEGTEDTGAELLTKGCGTGPWG